MSGLEFTEEAAHQLESLYLTKDIVAQRAETLKQLPLCRGDRVLDVGCGPGFLCESMAETHGQAFVLPSPPKVGAVCLNRARTDLCGGGE
jgi:2-polyprenyl-3-methyl-5-hydroxy-6-metoxy-1,4-benzoquinol methylase